LTLLSIRDPVDRAVSAYYWRSLILCHPHNEHRPVGPATNDPIQYCKEPESEAEVKVLFEDYEERNVNALAERLCNDDDDDNNNNSEESKKARRDLRRIQHLEHQIAGPGQWLPFVKNSNTDNDKDNGDWKLFAPRIFPIVMEKPYTLEQQIDAAIQWFFDSNAFEDENKFGIRKRWVQFKDKANNCTYDDKDGDKNGTAVNATEINVDVQTTKSSRRHRRLLQQQAQHQELASINKYLKKPQKNRAAKKKKGKNFSIENAMQFSSNNNKDKDKLAKKNNNVKQRFVTLTKDDIKQKRHFHSSSSHPNRTNPVLSPRGEYCLTQYYQKDYDTLRILKDKACKTNGCRNGVQRILDRRHDLLERLAAAE
jgi:hypothetical protein